MKASETSLLEFLRTAKQFAIPIYQRTYSWTEEQCLTLWRDILRIGSSGDVGAHFIGSVVYIRDDDFSVSSQSPLLVIDGQQRLTTVMLILEALARCLGTSEPYEDFSAETIRGYYLRNPLAKGERRFKLLLTQTDKESLLALMQQKPMPRDRSVRIERNFELFEELIQALSDDLMALCKGLEKLMIVDIALTRGQDNPQLIFESMNSTGLELTQADLIRNYILMGLDHFHQNELYKQYWRPMELAFGQEAYSTQFDSFMRHYLTLKTREIPKISAVYDAFKKHTRVSVSARTGFNSLADFVADIYTYSDYYCKMNLDQEQEEQLQSVFRDLRELRVDVAYPFLLELYHDKASGVLSPQDFTLALRLVEAYVFRRLVCDIPSKSLNKTFSSLGRALEKNRYLASLRACFLEMPSYRRFPSDDEFKRALGKRDLYNFSRRSYWLRRMENHDRKERVLIQEYTIEHILPQNKDLSEPWRKALGPEWDRIQEMLVHTLGNLTLTGYNSEYSDRPFCEKRDMEGGFRESPIRLNRSLSTLPGWNKDTIQERTEQLADLAVKVWAYPELPNGFRRVDPVAITQNAASERDISRHFGDGYLMRSLFEAFRKEVLALDPCVYESILKIYIAFKAETNFVDVVVQKKQLLLSLNMRFHELDDPRHVAKDTTGLGRWGNGDVEVRLTRHDELPYVLGLVRQSLERQLGELEIDS